MERYWIWYAQLFSFQDLFARKALEQYQSPEVLYHLPEEETEKFPADFRKKLAQKDLTGAEKIIQDCRRKNIRILCCDDAAFPECLRNIPDYPYVIYYHGKRYDFDRQPALAVVGTRRCTDYGASVAEGFSKELARSGMVIVSGLAMGVDGHAHMGALKAGGDTVAVMGCGLDIVYPKINRDIYDLIVSHGALISEYPPGTPVRKYHFPARNRLISGLSLGVLVVEAGQSSGSLITAHCALEQGRDVFAVPDSILSRNSIGSFQLMQQGAKCVARVDDILCEYEGQFAFRKALPQAVEESHDEMRRQAFVSSFTNLNETEQKIIGVLTEQPMAADDIVSTTGLTVSQVISSMTMLEIKKAVKALPGRRYRLNIENEV